MRSGGEGFGRQLRRAAGIFAAVTATWHHIAMTVATRAA